MIWTIVRKPWLWGLHENFGRDTSSIHLKGSSYPGLDSTFNPCVLKCRVFTCEVYLPFGGGNVGKKLSLLSWIE